MHYTQKPPACKRRFFTTPRVLYILGFVFAYLVSLAMFAPQVAAAPFSAPGGNVSDPVVREMDIARPAVVRIVTIMNGQLTVRFSASASATFPQGGSSYPLEMTGSGAFISAHGDILTADHVVNPPHDQNLDAFLYQEAAQDVADYINAHFQLTTPYSANDVYNLLLSGSLSSTTSYGQPSSEVYLSTSYTGSINAARLDTVPAADKAPVDRIEAQSNFSASDVAIIHASGMDNMPSIQLGDSSKVAELDNLTIIGYPGLGDLSQAPTDFLTSSINKVYVSALKETDAGDPVIEVGGNVEHGDSGGPALDDSGNIVGIVSFGYSGINGDFGQTSFLQASNSALTLIKSQGINTAPGAFENAWARAMNDYSSLAAGHWHLAAQELQSLKSSYPGFVGVTSFLTYAQNQASHESASGSASGGSLTSTLLIAFLILFLLLALGAGFYLIFRRNGRTVVVTPGGSQYPAGAYSLYQQQAGIQQPTGVYPQLIPTGYQANVPYLQPLPENPPGIQQAVSSGGFNSAYTLPSAYGALPVQVPQTPRPMVASEQDGGFSLPQIQTPPPVASDPVFGTPSDFALLTRPESEAGTLSHGLEKSALYPLPTHTRAPSDNSWPAFVPEEANGTSVAGGTAANVEEKTLLARSAARSFSVPGRPTSSKTATAESAALPYTLVAPCGHTNTSGVRFCRVCGQPVVTTSDNDVFL